MGAGRLVVTSDTAHTLRLPIPVYASIWTRFRSHARSSARQR